MRFDTSQQMRLGQQMRLAPRVIQSMEILQMPMPALEERIEQELESNVTLEAAEPGTDEAPGAETQEAVEQAERAEEQRADAREVEKPLSIDETGAGDFERLDSMESSYAEAYDNEYSAASMRQVSDFEPGTYSRSRLAGERDGKQDAMANTAARSASIGEQLAAQWSLAEVPDDVRDAGDLLISFIDEDGYIRTDLETIADRAPADRPRPSRELLERALGEVQRALEPTGIGARDTRECLLLQLDAIESDPQGAGVRAGEPAADMVAVRRLISEHLDDLVQNRLPKAAQKTGLSLEEIKRAVQWMQRLSAAPGLALKEETPPAIIPDAAIEYDDDADRYVARLTDNRLPALRINESYARMARERSTPKQTKEFIRTNLMNAQWLIDAINQRNHTLLRVISVVADAQRDFFDQGPQALRPLPMTQVADQLGVHVATVSRAVAGKHVQTPRGVMPLRRFFSGGTQTESGEEMSWDAVKAALQEIVSGEDKSNPLSDDALVDELKKRGIEIARRTVAKYRGQLDIPSARMRRRF